MSLGTRILRRPTRVCLQKENDSSGELDAGEEISGKLPWPLPFARRFRSRSLGLFTDFSAVGSEEAPIERLASVRRTNWTCGFPASSFYEWAFA